MPLADAAVAVAPETAQSPLALPTAGVSPLGLFPSDPVFLGMLVAILLFFFFLFLMVRRTVTAFNEGAKGRDR